MLIHIHSVLIPILLVFAGAFAAIEAALFSLSRTQLEGLRETRPNAYRKIQKLLQRPDVLLSTIIVGNECINITIGMLVVTLIKFHYGDLPLHIMVPFSVISSALLLLTFSEILPKILAFRMPIVTASLLVHPLMLAHSLLYPLGAVFHAISGRFIRFFGIQPPPPTAVSEKDFLSIIEAGADSGSLDLDEKELITNVFNFTDLTVGSIMTPWSKVFCVKDNLTIEQILDQIRQRHFSRIPMLSSRLDSVIGILYAKELLHFLPSPEGIQPTDSIMKAVNPPYIVSSHKKVSILFREFKAKKVHMALVVDEYGSQLGIITLEDLLKSLFKTEGSEGEAHD